MNVLVLLKNNVPQVAAELEANASVSVSLLWIGRDGDQLYVDIARNDGHRAHTWEPIQALIGDTIVIVTRTDSRSDKPKMSATHAETVALARLRPKMLPQVSVIAPFHEAGKLECFINKNLEFAVDLTSDKILTINFVWMGDDSGESLTYISAEGRPDFSLPPISFGDEVAFRTTTPTFTGP